MKNIDSTTGYLIVALFWLIVIMSALLFTSSNASSIDREEINCENCDEID